MLSNIDSVEAQTKSEVQDYTYNLVVQHVKEQEFFRVMHILREIDFAESDVLTTLFEYKFRDQLEKIDQSQEVTKEYHSGKLDPKQAMKMDKVKNSVKKKH